MDTNFTRLLLLERNNMENWDILQKELAIYGIGLDAKHNVVECDGGRVTINDAINKVKLRLKKERELFYEYIDKCLELLYNPVDTGNAPIDELRVKLFLHSLKRFCNLFELITSQDISRIYLQKDLSEYGKDVLEKIPDYLMSLDLLFRSCSIQRYKIKLLRCARAGERKCNINKYKLAAGVNAPWGRLDLPLLERVFPYNDIEEEMQGKRDDIKRQHRYKKGFEHYNDPSGRVGEGHYWRELRNEPFMWTDRFSDSPYVSMGSGTWR